MSISQSLASRRLLQGVVLFFSIISQQTVRAQTNLPSGPSPANRFLLVVETSHAMQRRADGTLRTINDLIGSRMRGQLRLGDSIGIWTFNETLYSGKLPLQEWSEGERSAIAGKILNFLQEQKFEKQGRLDKLLPPLLQLVKKSEFITVILVSEGSQELQGTPYDQQINQLYKQWSVQQQKARMPFITVLRAQRGQFTSFSVTPAPFAVEMPPLPVEMVRPKSQPNAPIVSSPKPAPPPMAPPLIISGRKHESPPLAVPSTNAGPLTLASAPSANQETAAQLAQSKQPDITVSSAAPIVADPKGSEPPAPGAVAAALSASATQAVVPTTEIRPTATLSKEPLPPEPLPLPTGTQAKSNQHISSSNALASKLDGTTQPQHSNGVAVPQIATAPAEPATSRARVVALGVLLAASAAWLGLWLWKRRTRPATHTSLITRSLDREQH